MSSTFARRALQVGVLVLLSALLVVPTVGFGGGTNPAHAFRDGTVLVGIAHGTSVAQIADIERGIGAAQVDVIGTGTHVLRVPNGEVLTKIATLEANRNVRYAEPDYVVHADGAAWSPNDPYFTKLWGMKLISATSAWGSTMGSSSVVVGVVDTGVDYTHPDLGANVWSTSSTINGCPAGTHGFNALSATCNPMADNRHGTHVSGTIGAVGNNGVGVIGVSPNVRIMGLKFLNSTGSGSTSGAVAAIDWAIKAKQAGANVRGANSVDLAAPGVSILSTVPGGYDSYSGTSMATPHVSGVAALALSTGYESVWTLKSTILAAVDPLDALAGRVATGGRLDVCKAIPACSGIAPPPPPPPPPSVGDFSLGTAESRQMVSPGGSTTYTATATASGGFAGQVALSMSGLPAGATASFTPTPLGISSTTSDTSTLSVSVAPATPPDTYTLTIVGTSGSLTHSTTVDLRVKRN